MTLSGMARLPRFELAGIPQHVVQRGNNHLPCFPDDEDRQRYVQCLRGGADAIWMSPARVCVDEQSCSSAGDAWRGWCLVAVDAYVARNYAGLFNGRHGRTGTLWERRYKACLVDSVNYFLACSRYIELNLVRAWMVAQPGDYPWSSYGANTGGKCEPSISPHSEYLALGCDPESRAAAYRALFVESLPDDLVLEIRSYMQQQKVLGTDRFRAWVEARAGRFSTVRPAVRSNG